MTYGINAKAVADNEALKGKPEFVLYDKDGKRGYVHRLAEWLAEFRY